MIFVIWGVLVYDLWLAIFGMALVLMSLVTTIITPIVYRNWFYKGEAVADTEDPSPCK